MSHPANWCWPISKIDGNSRNKSGFELITTNSAIFASGLSMSTESTASNVRRWGETSCYPGRPPCPQYEGRRWSTAGHPTLLGTNRLFRPYSVLTPARFHGYQGGCQRLGRVQAIALSLLPSGVCGSHPADRHFRSGALTPPLLVTSTRFLVSNGRLARLT